MQRVLRDRRRRSGRSVRTSVGGPTAPPTVRPWQAPETRIPGPAARRCSQRARLDVGDLEIVGEGWAQRQAGFIAIGDENSRVETRQRGDALESFISQRESAIRHRALAQRPVCQQSAKGDQKDDCQHDPRRALRCPERVLEPHVLQDGIIAIMALAHENGRAALNGNAGLAVSVPTLLPCIITELWRSRDLPVMACRRIEERVCIF